MRNRTLVPVLLLLLVTGLASLAAAQPGAFRGDVPPPGRPGPGFGPCGSFGPGQGAGQAFLLDRLDLSDEQRQQIDTLREKGRREALALRKQLLRLRNELHGEMLQDTPDADKVTRLARKIGDVKTQLRVHRLEQRLAVRKLLTPEQRDELLLMLARHGRRGGGAMGCMPGGRPGGRRGHGPRGGMPGRGL